MLTPIDYTELFNRCLYKELPFCSAKCPFHLNVLEFIEKIEKGMINSAFSTYRNAVAFPKIVSKICTSPCNEACPLGKNDKPIDLLSLEKHVISLSTNKKPNDYNIPKRTQRVAIIGGGISGLGLALRLSSKKYVVEIFEASDHIGGKQRAIVGKEIFDKEIEDQFCFEKYKLHLNSKLESREEINKLGFSAVYVATGKGGNDFGLLSAVAPNGDNYCLIDSTDHKSREEKTEGKIAWFAGGGLIDNDGVYALADGLLMGNVVEGYLKTGLLSRPCNDFSTSMKMHNLRLDSPDLTAPDLTAPKDYAIRNKDDAISELNSSANNECPSDISIKEETDRCLKCRCDACRTFCDLLDYTNKWPSRVKDEVIATTLPGTAEIKATPAKRLIFTCNQCGACKNECPENIDIGGLILSGRRSMHKQEKAPWVFHEFWLKDMDFSDGDLAKLVRKKSEALADYAFFPGCQLGASDPQIVMNTYDELCNINQATAIMLRCCGAPAEWSGDNEKHSLSINSIKNDWINLGKPTLLMACPTCIKKTREYLPEIPILSIYEYLAENYNSKLINDGKSNSKNPNERIYKSEWAIFDPCSAGDKDSVNNKDMREAVRLLSIKSELKLKPLPIQDEVARCCGYGGQPDIADPGYVDFVAEKRAQESNLPFITYCINCRDSFIRKGKNAKHILEILFVNKGQEAEDKLNLPTFTQRNENRIRLKNMLLNKHWNEKMEYEKKEYNFNLIISDELKKKINELKILEDEISDVIDHLLKTKRIVRNETTNILNGYMEVGNMTYWVSFQENKNRDEITLINVWCHRMKIEMEPVWKGIVSDDRIK